MVVMVAPSTFEEYVEKRVPLVAEMLADVAAGQSRMPTTREILAMSRGRTDKEQHSLIYHLAQFSAALEQAKTWLGHFEEEVRKLRSSATPPADMPDAP